MPGLTQALTFSLTAPPSGPADAAGTLRLSADAVGGIFVSGAVPNATVEIVLTQLLAPTLLADAVGGLAISGATPSATVEIVLT